jgi:putative ABC transport system permease protein
VRSTLHLSVLRFLRTPRWTLPILLTLVVAIGATAAIFAVVDAVFLRSYPYQEPGRLVALHDERRAMKAVGLGLSAPELLDYGQQSRAVSALGAYTQGRVAAALDRPRQLEAAWMTGGLLKVLGAAPRLGRGFTPEELRPGGLPVALVSDAFWRRWLGGRTDLRGASLRLEDEVVQVVGVLPPDFRLPPDLSRSRQTDVYRPLVIDPAAPGSRQNSMLSVVGRLAPGATVAGARAEQLRIAQGFQAANPMDYPARMGFAMSLAPLTDEVVGDVRGALLIVCGAVGLLFLVALGNAGGLILARLDDRRREVGIRIAMGARFRQLFRGFVTESLVLTVAAGIPGVALAVLLVRFLLAAHADTIPRLHGLGMDRWVALFFAATTLCIVLVFAVASTVHIVRSTWARSSLSREAPASESGLRPGTGRQALAGGQVALTVALTVGAAFLISSYRNLMAVDLGFRPEHVLVVDVSLPSGQYDRPQAVTAFFASLLRELRVRPGVASAGLVSFLPLEQPAETWPVEVRAAGDTPGAEGEGTPGTQGGRPSPVDAQVVSEGYFRTLGIPVRAGRDFGESDALAQAPTVVVDEAFVRRYLPAVNPLGRTLRPRLSPDAPWATIVGVVGDVRHASVTEAPRPRVYYLYQHIPRFAGVAVGSMQLAVRTRGEPMAAAGLVRSVAGSLDPQLALGPVRSMDDVVAHATSRARFPMQLLGIFAFMAVVVSLSGIYAVLSQLVSASRRDLGIRSALGATPSSILVLVLRKGMGLTLGSVAAGVVLAALLVRSSRHFFYGVGAGTLSIYLAAALGVSLAAGVACLIPARRASRIDPAQALRESA